MKKKKKYREYYYGYHHAKREEFTGRLLIGAIGLIIALIAQGIYYLVTGHFYK